MREGVREGRREGGREGERERFLTNNQPQLQRKKEH